MNPEKIPDNLRRQPTIKSLEQNRKVLVFRSHLWALVNRGGTELDITTALDDEQKSRKIADSILDAAADVAAHGRAPAEPEGPYKRPSQRETEAMQEALIFYGQLLALSLRHGITEENLDDAIMTNPESLARAIADVMKSQS